MDLVKYLNLPIFRKLSNLIQIIEDRKIYLSLSENCGLKYPKTREVVAVICKKS